MSSGEVEGEQNGGVADPGAAGGDAPEAQRAVTERIEREEFARGHIGPDDPPVEPKPAATIVLGRSARGSGFEVLLLQRPATARFAAGAYVFPGGKVDAGDSARELADRLPEAGRGSEPSAVLAALRELFEETGLLLADRRLKAEAEARLRTDLLSEVRTLDAAARELDLRFTSTRLCYFARWITPRRFSRRYDTRFFLAELPADRRDFVPDLTDEIVAHTWITPSKAVKLFRAGRLPMLFPTRVTLDALSEFGSIDQVFRRYDTEDVEAKEPRLLIRGDSIRPVLPGDPEYEEAGA